METKLEPRDALVLERSLRLFKYLYLNEPQPPFKLILTPTDRCNLNCIFCPNYVARKNQRFKAEDELTDEEWLNVIEQGVRLGVRQWCILGGGEPLLRREIILPALEKIKKGYKTIDVEIITNGTLFTEKMINEIIKIGWDEIVLSLDAPVKEINDYLRGNGFEEVVNTIKTFQLKKKKAKKEKPMINIHMVLCNKNYMLLPKMFEFVYNLDCRNLLVEPIVLLAKKTRAGKELLFKEKDKKNLIKYLHEATKIAYKHNFQTNVDKLEFELIKSTAKMKKVIEKEGKDEKNIWTSLPCYQPFYRMIVRPWGIVGPCCMFEYSDENVNKKSLKEIWFGEYFQKMRNEMIKRNLPEFCSKCNPSQVQENRKIREEIRKLI